MFGLGKKNNEWLPWYRRKDYKGNLTEAEKRELDAFRTQRKHPATSYSDLPDGVRSYISDLEMELYDLKNATALKNAVFMTIAIGLALYGAYKDWFELYSPTFFYIFAPIAVIVSWINYKQETAKIEDEFFPKGDGAPSGTDEAIRKNGNSATYRAADIRTVRNKPHSLAVSDNTVLMGVGDGQPLACSVTIKLRADHPMMSNKPST